MSASGSTMPKHPYESLFYLPEGVVGNVGNQLQSMLSKIVLDGVHPSDCPLPSSRRLAAQLGVARSTVSEAYSELVERGLLISKERSGYFINPRASQEMNSVSYEKSKAYEDKPFSKVNINWDNRLKTSTVENQNIEKPKDWLDTKYCFVSGQVDPASFPIAEWRNCSRESLGMVSVNGWVGDSIVEDCDKLVEQIRQRLLPRRGIVASEDEILVTLGAQNALFLLATALLNRQSVMGIENPGYPDARNTFALHTDNIQNIPIDNNGICLTESLENCDCVYVTPSHQAPTTVTMPMERRRGLLDMAQKNDFLIIEDDYDSDVNFDARPLPALKSMDESGRVIYCASLSKTLAPGLRIGFVVGSKPLIDELRALRRMVLRHPPTNAQLTLSYFLAQGSYDALVLRLRKTHKRRWQILHNAMLKHLKSCRPMPVYGGSSVWIEGPKNLDCRELAEAAHEAGILLEPGAVYFDQPETPCPWFRLGVSVIEDELIEPGIIALEKLIVSLVKDKSKLRVSID